MNIKKFVLASAAVLALSASAFAASVKVTPIGQSSDGMMVKVVLKSLKVAADYVPLMKAADLADGKVLITVVGASSKGLGAAGISQEAELARAEELCKAASEKGMKVLVMHVGGQGRRGGASNKFIKAAAAYADKFIVVDGGNTDGFFNPLAEARKAEILTAATVKTTKEPLKATLTAWGLL